MNTSAENDLTQTHLTLLYVSAYAGYGVLLPFLPLVLRSRGLPDSSVAFALSAMGLSALVGPVLFAFLADKGVSFRRLFLFMVLMSALIAPSLVVFHDTWALSALVFAEFVFYLPALSLCDQYTLNLLASKGSPSIGFQSARRWGSIGFMLPALLLVGIGQFMDISSTLLVLLCSTALLVAGVVALRLPEVKNEIKRSRAPTVEAIKVAKGVPLRDFFIAALLTGIAASIFYTMFPRYLEEMGCSTVTIGLIVNFGVLCETLLMPYTTALINRFGVERVICFGMCSIAVRLVILILFPDLVTSTLVQALHAPMVIGLFVAVPIYIQGRSSESIRYSLQSLYAATMMGGARLLGPNIAGLAILLTGAQGLNALRFTFVLGAVLGAIGGYWMYRRVVRYNPSTAPS